MQPVSRLSPKRHHLIIAFVVLTHVNSQAMQKTNSLHRAILWQFNILGVGCDPLWEMIKEPIDAIDIIDAHSLIAAQSHQFSICNSNWICNIDKTWQNQTSVEGSSAPTPSTPSFLTRMVSALKAPPGTWHCWFRASKQQSFSLSWERCIVCIVHKKLGNKTYKTTMVFLQTLHSLINWQKKQLWTKAPCLLVNSDLSPWLLDDLRRLVAASVGLHAWTALNHFT